jgi:hypothetical protein
MNDDSHWTEYQVPAVSEMLAKTAQTRQMQVMDVPVPSACAVFGSVGAVWKRIFLPVDCWYDNRQRQG